MVPSQGQRTTGESWFLSSTLWVLGREPRSPGVAAGAFTCGALTGLFSSLARLLASLLLPDSLTSSQDLCLPRVTF